MISQQSTPREIFTDLIANYPPAQWHERVVAACQGDERLRRRVEALLKAHQEQDSLPIPPAQPLETVNQAGGHELGTMIGPYKLLEQIGEGGMGLVYMAEQQRPVRRLVALKIIKPGFDTKQTIARFEAERQALALMDHPNIAKILDAGTVGQSTKSQASSTKQIQRTKLKSQNGPGSPVSDIGPSNLEIVCDLELGHCDLTSGRPFFVMELVRGLPINEFCDEKRLSVPDRLKLFTQVCQAVQHAHQKGIIHRDLKPTNVLVTMHDSVPVPMIIDFGIAKALGQSLTDHTLHTGFAQLVGTPLYMSPEQAEMNQFGVDTRSDLYSLGVMLYELLTGTTPFDKETLTKAGFDEMRRIIREDDPPRPSARLSTLKAEALSTVSTRRRIDSRRITTALRGELDWIVMKSLEKERSERYESASSLSKDLERYLSGDLVQACPPSASYRFRKFARRNKTALTTAALLAASLLLGVTISVSQAIRATAAEAQANQNAAQAAANEAKAKVAEEKALTAAASETALRKQTEKNFESALDAVDRLIANVSNQELYVVERIGPLRSKMLRDAIAFYERIPLDGSLPLRIRRRFAGAWDRLAWLCREVDENDQARRAYAKAIETMQGLVNEPSSSPSDLAELGRFYQSAGWFYLDSSHEPAAAESAFRQSAELYAEARRRNSNEPSHQIWQAHSFNGLGIALARLDKHDQAVGAVARAVELIESSDIASGADLGNTLHELALIKAKAAPDDADELFRRAVKVYREFSVSGKMPEHNREQLAAMLYVTAQAFASRHPNEAQQLWDESIELWKQINGPAPSKRSAGNQHIAALLNQARHLRSLAKLPAAPEIKAAQLEKSDKLFQEAIVRQRQMVSRFSIPDDRYTLSGTLRQQSLFLLEQRQVEKEDAAAIKSQADSLLTESIQICRALAAEFPATPRFKSRLAELEKIQSKHFLSDAENPERKVNAPPPDP
jgi:eukaryotic-like serine/threonine-protein kinase